ncbi:MAG: hypothetical protein V1660_03300 [archaeon]
MYNKQEIDKNLAIFEKSLDEILSKIEKTSVLPHTKVCGLQGFSGCLEIHKNFLHRKSNKIFLCSEISTLNRGNLGFPMPQKSGDFCRGAVLNQISDINSGKEDKLLHERAELTLNLADIAQESLEKYSDDYINNVRERIAEYRKIFKTILI